MTDGGPYYQIASRTFFVLKSSKFFACGGHSGQKIFHNNCLKPQIPNGLYYQIGPQKTKKRLGGNFKFSGCGSELNDVASSTLESGDSRTWRINNFNIVT